MDCYGTDSGSPCAVKYIKRSVADAILLFRLLKFVYRNNFIFASAAIKPFHVKIFPESSGSAGKHCSKIFLDNWKHIFSTGKRICQK